MSVNAIFRQSRGWFWLKTILDLAALVSELKHVLDGIGLLSIGQRFPGLSKAGRNHPLDCIVRRQIINSSYVPNNSP